MFSKLVTGISSNVKLLLIVLMNTEIEKLEKKYLLFRMENVLAAFVLFKKKNPSLCQGILLLGLLSAFLACLDKYDFSIRSLS